MLLKPDKVEGISESESEMISFLMPCIMSRCARSVRPCNGVLSSGRAEFMAMFRLIISSGLRTFRCLSSSSSVSLA